MVDIRESVGRSRLSAMARRLIVGGALLSLSTSTEGVGAIHDSVDSTWSLRSL